MNIEELKKQAETEIADFIAQKIADFIAQKIAELNKNTGKEVSEIRFIAREKMTGLESYDVKIKIM
ncbi:addiction module toxin, GnsA/GnsB family [Shigella flexneri]|nr:addiction module toxin, GnsA/GnsB family [Shigella flexneri]HAY7248808.1 addiction module toxin, GnsA/GnsB family [Shigella flexneri]